MGVSGSSLFEDVGAISASLAGIRTLRGLTLDAANSGSPFAHLDEAWTSAVWPGLHELTLGNLHITESTIAFIDAHSATLQRLTIALPRQTKPPYTLPAAPYHHSKLPLLTALVIKGAHPQPLAMILQSVANTTTADEVHPRSHSTLKELSITFKRFNLDESQDLLAQDRKSVV